MDSAVRIEPESGIAIVTGTGVLGVADARAGAAALWNETSWPGEAAVWDFRAAHFDVTPNDARELATFVLRGQRTPPPRRVAFVLGREVDFGLARMFGVYRERPETEFEAFRDLDAALRWARSADADSSEAV